MIFIHQKHSSVFSLKYFLKFNQTGGGGIEGRSDTDLRIWATGDIGGERNESVFKSKEGFGIPRKDSLRTYKYY